MDARQTLHPARIDAILTAPQTRHRGGFAHIDNIDGDLPDSQALRLCRLRNTRSAHHWVIAICRASHDDDQDSFLPTGAPAAPLSPSTPPADST